MAISFTASTSTGTGTALRVDPPATTFGVQFDGNSTGVNYLLKGSINGDDFVDLVVASTARTGTPTLLSSTIGPMSWVRVDVTTNDSATAVAGWVSAVRPQGA